jgi:hypothetical protein
MFVVIEGRILKEVCEMELARLRQGYGARVELVVRMERDSVTTTENVYEMSKLEKGRMK